STLFAGRDRPPPSGADRHDQGPVDLRGAVVEERRQHVVGAAAAVAGRLLALLIALVLVDGDEDVEAVGERQRRRREVAEIVGDAALAVEVLALTATACSVASHISEPGRPRRR